MAKKKAIGDKSGSAGYDDEMNGKNLGDDYFNEFENMGVGEPDTNSRHTSKRSKEIITEGLKGVGSGVLTGVRTAVNQAMPNTASLYGEASSYLSEFRSLKNQFARDIAPGIKSLKTVTKTFLGSAKSFLPEKLYTAIDKKLEVEPEGKSAATLKRESEAAAIKSAMESVFAEQTKTDVAMHQEDRAERLVDRGLETSRHESNMEMMKAIREASEVQANFVRGTYTAYLKESLKLQYTQMFIAKDSFAALSGIAKILEVKLEEIKHNTSLPEYVKTTYSEFIKSQVKQQGAKTWSDFINNFRTKLFANVKDRIFDTGRMMMDQVVMMADSVQQMQDMQQQMGGGGGTAGIVTNMAGNVLGNWIGKAGAKVGLDKLKPFVGKWDQLMGNVKAGIFRKINTLGKNSTGFLGSMVPTFDSRFNLQDHAWKNPRGSAHFDNLTRLSIVEVIPGYLAQMTKLLADIKTGSDTESVVYDWKSKSVKTHGSIKKRLEKEAFGREGQRGGGYKKAINVLQAGLKDSGSNIDITDQKDAIAQVMLNMAQDGTELPIEALRNVLGKDSGELLKKLEQDKRDLEDKASGQYEKMSAEAKKAFDQREEERSKRDAQDRKDMERIDIMLNGISDPLTRQKVLNGFTRGLFRSDGSVNQEVMSEMNGVVDELIASQDKAKTEFVNNLAEVGMSAVALQDKEMSDEHGNIRQSYIRKVQTGGDEIKFAEEDKNTVAGILAKVRKKQEDHEEWVSDVQRSNGVMNWLRERFGKDLGKLHDSNLIKQIADTAGLVDRDSQPRLNVRNIDAMYQAETGGNKIDQQYITDNVANDVRAETGPTSLSPMEQMAGLFMKLFSPTGSEDSLLVRRNNHLQIKSALFGMVEEGQTWFSELAQALAKAIRNESDISLLDPSARVSTKFQYGGVVPGRKKRGIKTMMEGELGASSRGGVTTGPIKALVGEAGSEAIIPLQKLEEIILKMSAPSGWYDKISKDMDTIIALLSGGAGGGRGGSGKPGMFRRAFGAATSFGGKVLGGIGSGLSAIGGTAMSVLGGVGRGAAGLAGKFIEKLPALVEGMGKAAGKITTGLGRFVAGAGKAVKAIGEGLAPALTATMNTAGKIFTNSVEMAGKAFGWTVEKAGKVFDWTSEKITKGLGWVKDSLFGTKDSPGLLGKVLGVPGSVIRGAKDLAVGAAKGLWNAGGKLWRSITGPNKKQYEIQYAPITERLDKMMESGFFNVTGDGKGKGRPGAEVTVVNNQFDEMVTKLIKFLDLRIPQEEASAKGDFPKWFTKMHDTLEDIPYAVHQLFTGQTGGEDPDGKHKKIRVKRNWWTKTKRFLRDDWNKTKERFTGAVDKVKNFGSSVWSGIKNIGGEIKAGILLYFNQLRDFFTQNIKIPESVRAAFTTIYDYIVKKITASKEAIKAAFDTVSEFVKTSAIPKIKTMWEAVATFMTKERKFPTEWLKTMKERAKTAMKNAAEWIGGKLGAAGRGIAMAYNWAKQKLSAAWDLMTPKVKEAWDTVWGFLTTDIKVPESIKTALRNLKDMLMRNAGKVKDAIKALLHEISDWIKSANIPKHIKEAWDVFVKFLGSIIGGVAGFLAGTVAGLKDAVVGAAKAAWKGMKALARGSKNVGKGIGKKIMGMMTGDYTAGIAAIIERLDIMIKSLKIISGESKDKYDADGSGFRGDGANSKGSSVHGHAGGSGKGAAAAGPAGAAPGESKGVMDYVEDAANLKSLIGGSRAMRAARMGFRKGGIRGAARMLGKVGLRNTGRLASRFGGSLANTTKIGSRLGGRFVSSGLAGLTGVAMAGYGAYKGATQGQAAHDADVERISSQSALGRGLSTLTGYKKGDGFWGNVGNALSAPVTWGKTIATTTREGWQASKAAVNAFGANSQAEAVSVEMKKVMRGKLRKQLEEAKGKAKSMTPEQESTYKALLNRVDNIEKEPSVQAVQSDVFKFIGSIQPPAEKKPEVKPVTPPVDDKKGATPATPPVVNPATPKPAVAAAAAAATPTIGSIQAQEKTVTLIERQMQYQQTMIKLLEQANEDRTKTAKAQLDQSKDLGKTITDPKNRATNVVVAPAPAAAPKSDNRDLENYGISRAPALSLSRA